MLDINDLIAERGGDPKRVRESQKRRYASEALVDEVMEMFEDHKKTKYAGDGIKQKVSVAVPLW